MVQTNFNNLFNYVIAKETLNRKRRKITKEIVIQSSVSILLNEILYLYFETVDYLNIVRIFFVTK